MYYVVWRNCFSQNIFWLLKMDHCLPKKKTFFNIYIILVGMFFGIFGRSVLGNLLERSGFLLKSFFEETSLNFEISWEERNFLRREVLEDSPNSCFEKLGLKAFYNFNIWFMITSGDWRDFGVPGFFFF